MEGIADVSWCIIHSYGLAKLCVASSPCKRNRDWDCVNFSPSCSIYNRKDWKRALLSVVKSMKQIIDRHESRPNAMKRLNRYVILRFLCWGGDIAFFSISPRDGLSQERERRNAWRWRTKRLERMRRYYVLHIGITSVANQNCNLIEQSLNRNPRSSQSHRSFCLAIREMTSRRFRLLRKIPRDNC